MGRFHPHPSSPTRPRKNREIPDATEAEPDAIESQPDTGPPQPPADDPFGRLARCYRGLEVLAFGRALERARFAFVDDLAGARSVLLLGDGDGRFLERLLAVDPPPTSVNWVDNSPGMAARAQRRLRENPATQTAIRWHIGPAEDCQWPPGSVDAVVTLFFLDCFEAEPQAALIKTAADAMRPDGKWLYADFDAPAATSGNGFFRLRNRLWVALLYRFFRIVCGIPARRLHDPGPCLQGCGLGLEKQCRFRNGLLVARLYRKPEKVAETEPN